MNVIVFSKDRACQLEAFLSSCEHHFPDIKDCNVSIIYRFTTAEYGQGYDICKQAHAGYKWVLEQPGQFKACVMSAIDARRAFTVFFVDDQIWTAPLSKKDTELKNFGVTGQQICLSLRLHPGLTYAYAMNAQMRPPKFHHKNLWQWAAAMGDFAYPMSLDGHIFKTRMVLPALEEFNFKNPNQLEGSWAKRPFPGKYLMGCYDTARVINIPFNKVNEECNNRSMSRSAEELNQRYLTGGRVDWMQLKGYVGNAVHVEMELPVIGGVVPKKAVVRAGAQRNGYEISIVTGTLNRRRLLPGLIKNTVAASKKVELILVDGGSTDGTQAFIKNLNCKQIKLVEVGGRSPYPDFMNRGILQTGADLICQWNDDVLLESSWDDVLKAVVPEIDVYLFAWKNGKVKDWTIYCDPPREVVMNYGIYRRRVFEKVGMYNPAFQYYRADGDMAYRAWAFGCGIMPCRSIHVCEIKAEKRALLCTEADNRAYDDCRAIYRAGKIPENIERLAPR